MQIRLDGCRAEKLSAEGQQGSFLKTFFSEVNAELAGPECTGAAAGAAEPRATSVSPSEWLGDAERRFSVRRSFSLVTSP